ncbi:hypothetical protein SESBI_07039 [Sesbania bispinosa]|nr:hypothetical protein SESBI_07039 [Sesbania bispinosa]
MCKEDRDAFNRRYGRILDLLAIKVKTKSLSALAQIWNTDLRCFELPNLDMVPTIEEYDLMVRFPVKEKDVVYQYKGRYVDEKKIAKLIGLLPNQLKFEKRGSILGLRRTFFEDHLKVLAEQGHWKHFKITLALTIYGLIFFPFISDMVDQAAMDFSFSLKRMEPTPSRLSSPHFPFYYVFQRRILMQEGGMKNFLIIKTTRSHGGCVAYTPSIVLRQLKCTQIKPVEEPLGGASFLYGTNDVGLLIEEIKSAWGDIKWKGEKELGKNPSGEKCKKAKKGKRKEEDNTSAKMKKMQDHLELMEKETQATNLANHVHDAVEEVNSNPEIKLPWKTFRLMKFFQDVVRRKIINQPSKVYPRHPYRTRYQVRMMEDLTLENEELKKEIKQMRAEMDKMSESMRIMEKQNAEGTSTVKQMTQMFEAMQKSAEKRSMVDTTETAATPDYPPGFTQGLMPVTVHLNKPVQQVDPPEVQWPLYGLPPNYTPPIANNASNQTAKPQGSDAKVADSQITPPQGSATNVVGVTTTPSAQQVFNSATPSSQEKGSAAAVLGVTPAQNVQWFPGSKPPILACRISLWSLVLLRVKAKV